MCVGIPMQVKSLPSEGRAVCVGRGQTENLDVMLLGNVEAGDWVLAWNGMAVKKSRPKERYRLTKRLTRWKPR